MFDIFAFNSSNSCIKEEISFNISKPISENLVQNILALGSCQTFKLPFQYDRKLIIDVMPTYKNKKRD